MSRNACPHLNNLAQIVPADLCQQKKTKLCSSCQVGGPNLWICLSLNNNHKSCHSIGCSDKHNDHSTLHFESTRHAIQMNLSSQRIWCYLCECEVYFQTQMNNRARVPFSTISPIDSHDIRRISHFYHQQQQQQDYQGEGGSPISGSDYDDEEFDYQGRLNGLIGLKNIANTCYMNSALQALSNSPPLTRYFLKCGNYVQKRTARSKIGLAKSYTRLIKEMWLNDRRGYIVPDEIIRGISTIHPMFRGYQQHDTQEFLRCFMDQLHEELKEVTPPPETSHPSQHQQQPQHQIDENDLVEDSVSEAEYETCDSGVSEQSSLSDEVSTNSKRIRKISRSPSPQLNQRHTITSSNASTASMLSNRAGSSSSLNQNPENSNQQPKIIHRSIISDIFDGKLLSSVQCLTCDRVSTREETFQDLSLPIPGRDHLSVLHQAQNPPPLNINLSSNSAAGTCTNVVRYQDHWVWWFFVWLKSWFWGPAVGLHDCMGAFFSADELKGDNMYSCEKCNKLRNGIKFSRVLDLPEMLCVHLKRFRHDLSYSSKISSIVNFPLSGLDMRQYLHKDCKSKVSTYDLNAVICHHGTVGSGHYICYAKHAKTNKWYEYDDQTVTQVSSETVQNCEAYVLFYQKSNPQMEHIRSQVQEIIKRSPCSAYPASSDIKFFISKQWLNKFNTFAEPGPIDNSNVLCQHGSLLPNIVANVSDLLVPINQTLWEYFYEKFGGGPVCNHIIECDTCKSRAQEIERRQVRELEIFSELRDEFQYQDNSSMLFAISMNWFRRWQAFARGETNDDPGPINNLNIAQQNESLPIRNVRPGSDYAQINLKLWKFFHSMYGGGPEIILRGAHDMSKFEAEAELVDTAENLSLNDDPEDSEATMLEHEEITPNPTPAPPLKTTKSVSFEDTNHNISSSDDENEPKIEKQFSNAHGQVSKKSTSQLNRDIEMLLKSQKQRRTGSEQTTLFGIEGTIRYITDEANEMDGQNNNKTLTPISTTNQKPKRNGVDTDSEDESATFARPNTVHHNHGHHHHRSSRKKSKSVRTK